jgi:hypothetical protein
MYVREMSNGQILSILLFISQMTVSQMLKGQMSISKMCIGQISSSQMFIGQMTVSLMLKGLMFLGQMSICQMFFDHKAWHPTFVRPSKVSMLQSTFAINDPPGK